MTKDFIAVYLDFGLRRILIATVRPEVFYCMQPQFEAHAKSCNAD